MDGFSRKKLESIRQSGDHRFHGLLKPSQLHSATHYDFDALLAEAESILDASPHPVDGILNFWDFPASAIHAFLCERFDVPGPSIGSVVQCDHKYWSRVEQQKAVPESVPAFHVFDPFDENARAGIPLEYPFWVKPVLSYSSYLAFPVNNDKDLQEAMRGLRDGAQRFGKPFLDMVDHIRPPPDGEFTNPHLCLAESPIEGQQCTVEGFVLGGEVQCHGIIDTHWYDDDSEPSRYQYPSRLPGPVQDRMIDTSRRLLRHIGYDNAGYNIEYYYDAEKDTIGLLEINSRVSQSHSDIFEKVDGRSNHEIAVCVAEGRTPQTPSREGTYAVAAKFFVRTFIEDGLVKRIPTAQEIESVEQAFPGTLVQLSVEEGMRLSDILDEDTYSHRLAMVHTAAEDEAALLRKYAQIEEKLPFHVEPLAAKPRLVAR